MTINVVNKRSHTPTPFDFYIGRPSVLGNPYSHLNYSKHNTIKVASREEAVRLYGKWLANQLSSYEEVAETLDDLVDLYMEHGVLNLVCWCAPAACHGDLIKKKVEELTAKLRTNAQ